MHGPEDKYVKVPALVHATRLGWRYRSIRNDKPGTDYDPDTNIFYDLFGQALRRINPDMDIDDDQVRFLIRKSAVTLDSDDLGRAFFSNLQHGLDGYRLIDFTTPDNNDFTVVTEFTYAHDDDNFRPDIIFLINGMPLCFMEVKRLNNRNGILAERDRMYTRFRQPFFCRFANITQIMAFSNDQPYDDGDREPIQGSFYATSSYDGIRMNRFREEEDSGRELLQRLKPRSIDEEKLILKDNNLISLLDSPQWNETVDPRTPANSIITSLFSRERLMFLLRYGLCYKDYVNDNGIRVIEKHIMRYPQFFASQSARRTLDGGVRQGVIWHTQGSGKTELAFLLTRYLRDYYQEQRRVLYTFFIVDRLDLANQADDEFRSRGATVIRVDSRDDFVKLLRKPSAWNTGQGDGITISPVKIAVVNIQKFSADAQAITAEYGLNEQRLFFIDEAHREYKPGKSFLAALFNADRDAVRIALTGTPLIRQKNGADTKQVFGEYIHTYFYDRSIADGYTLRLLREDVKPQFRVRMRSIMDTLQEIDKLTDLDQVCEHPHFVEPLAEYIVNDLMQSRIALGKDCANIGAMIVARTSQQARNIYDALQQYDPDLSSALVLYDEGSKEDQRDIQKRFKRGEIDILVVFNMLLTGFDAPRLKKMYLCRPLKAHNLLQALTRVNRPYKSMDHGFVVDFVDISKQFDQTNQDYLAELNGEFGQDAARYASLFDDPKAIKADLSDIKDTLWQYSTDNEYAFAKEISAIQDEDELYRIRRALERYKELRNLATLYGYDELDEHFDIALFGKLLNEVNLRIGRINEQKALKLGQLSTGSLNILLDHMEFSFEKEGTEELTVADKLKRTIRTACGSFQGNDDPKDPAYVNLLDKLREKLVKANMQELTTDEMTDLIGQFEELAREADELNRKNDLLAGKYGGDVKFMRIHKEMMGDDQPMASSDAALFRILSSLRRSIDATVERNAAALDQPAIFKHSIGPTIIKAFKDNDVTFSPSQVKTTVDRIYNEYSDERKTRLA
ncbi:type I restriction enzyme subunit R domain-containing protein [Bifidobacterium simiiventris]|uniref:type I restriction enzyme subunit R domain-containing protein n=1 Tax=Bifidobacterium simiiventris TaxID=2834434 RepID=UPI001C57E7DA|nr:DEAD/DEAH box helicase family protein [Bifidobacterium simiiventris]MBW3078257.1 type I restriction endonuclease subunit R [Bifidobacterium simiiventris]